MSEYKDQKGELARKMFSSNVKSLIDIVEDSYYEQFSQHMSYLHYILEFRTLHIQAPRQIGKSTILKELCRYGKKTLFVVCNDNHARYLYNNKVPEHITIRTKDWINSRACKLNGIGRLFHYERIVFDECYSKELLEEIITKLNLWKAPNIHMSVIALGSPAL
jgi:hypothetical protein